MSMLRFDVSLEKELLEALTNYASENHFTNRSQTIRNLVNNNVINNKWLCNNMVVGSITLVYDDHKRDLVTNLNNLQDDYHDVILSSQHFYQDHDLCLELIAVKEKAVILTKLAELLIAN